MKKTAQSRFNRDQVQRGFTLVELLVVIAIIAILAAVVVLIINPLELTRRSRDAARLTDLANLQQAINVAVQEASNSGQNIACNGTGSTCSSNSVAGTRITNGTGWVQMNLGVQTSVSVPTLPIDPTNTNSGGPSAGSAANKGYHYLYCGSGDNWEIITVLESVQQSPKMSNDGGTTTDSNDYYEVGSVLNLLGTGTCTY